MTIIISQCNAIIEQVNNCVCSQEKKKEEKSKYCVYVGIHASEYLTSDNKLQVFLCGQWRVETAAAAPPLPHYLLILVANCQAKLAVHVY